MKEYLSTILRGIISSPFIIDEVQDRDKILLSIHNLTKEDYYKAVGYKGATADAIRQLMRTWAQNNGTKVTVYIPNTMMKK